jgi:hypothetical protein
MFSVSCNAFTHIQIIFLLLISLIRKALMNIFSLNNQIILDLKEYSIKLITFFIVFYFLIFKSIENITKIHFDSFKSIFRMINRSKINTFI